MGTQLETLNRPAAHNVNNTYPRGLSSGFRLRSCNFAILALRRRMPRYIDIGANMTDAMFRGVYREKQKHEDDLDAVLERGWNVGLDKVMVTAGLSLIHI